MTYLVFGKTVRIRRYRVTVSVESLAIWMKPLEQCSGKAVQAR